MNDLIDWTEVKKAYDNGLTDSELAEMFNVKKNTITVKRNRAKWGKANRTKKTHNKSVTKKKDDKKKPVIKNDKVTNKKSDKLDYEVVPKSAEGLNKRERLFCLNYIKSYNAIQSYIDAFDSSYKNAHIHCYSLLKNSSIQSYLSDLRKRQSEKLMITADDVLLKYVKQMNANIGDYIDFRTVKKMRVDSKGKPIADADGQPIYDYNTEVWLRDKSKMDLSMVNEIQNGRDGISIKLPDKQKAMIELLKRLDSGKAIELKNKRLELDNELIAARIKALSGSDDVALSKMEEIIKIVTADEEEYAKNAKKDDEDEQKNQKEENGK